MDTENLEGDGGKPKEQRGFVQVVVPSEKELQSIPMEHHVPGHTGILSGIHFHDIEVHAEQDNGQNREKCNEKGAFGHGGEIRMDVKLVRLYVLLTVTLR